MDICPNSLLFAFSTGLDFVEREVLGVTTNHSKRVALLTTRMCAHMGMDAKDIFDMASCAVLHDNALTEYTLRVGAAAARERKRPELHCLSGEAHAMQFPFQGDASGIVLNHHENWDGTGFFQRRGGEVSVRAAALRLADNTDLLLGMGHGKRDVVREKALAHVRNNREKLYAPDVADAFAAVCDAALMEELEDTRIDAALRAHIPPAPVGLALEELLRVCAIFADITDAKSPVTARHCRGVSEKTRRMATALHLEPVHAMRLEIAAHLHDIGKLGTAAAVLEKPDRLTDEEFEIMRRHVLITAEILKPIKGLEEIAFWASTHHEKLDGSGYPFSLTAEELPFESRLLTCVDIYQALVEDRPYRKGMSHAKAMAILYVMADKGKVDCGIVDAMRTALA